MKKITIASRDKVQQYSYEVLRVLKFLGHPEALVTDESLVSDFSPPAWRRRWVQKFDLPMPKRNPFIWELAAALHDDSVRRPRVALP